MQINLTFQPYLLKIIIDRLCAYTEHVNLLLRTTHTE